MADSRDGYAGKIGHGGQQYVKAPFAKKPTADQSRIHTGTDLRMTAGKKLSGNVGRNK